MDKTHGQVAFEAFQLKRQEQTPDISAAEWGDLDSGLQECWDAVADAVVSSDYKSQQEK